MKNDNIITKDEKDNLNNTMLHSHKIKLDLSYNNNYYISTMYVSHQLYPMKMQYVYHCNSLNHCAMYSRANHASVAMVITVPRSPQDQTKRR